MQHKLKNLTGGFAGLFSVTSQWAERQWRCRRAKLIDISRTPHTAVSEPDVSSTYWTCTKRDQMLLHKTSVEKSKWSKLKLESEIFSGKIIPRKQTSKEPTDQKGCFKEYWRPCWLSEIENAFQGLCAVAAGVPREDPATLDIRIRKKRTWEPQPSSHHESGAWKDDPSVKMLPLQREDLSSVPRTHISVLTTARNSNPGDLLTTLGATHTHSNLYSDRQAHTRAHTPIFI